MRWRPCTVAHVSQRTRSRPVTAEQFYAEARRAGGRVLPVRRDADGDAQVDGELVSYTMSTASVDRPGDTVAVGGWLLENYRKNPVLVWAHNYSLPPIGRVGEVLIDGGKLIGRRVQFTPEEMNPFGAMIGRMVRGGFLPAGSVGFQPHKWVWNEQRGGVDFVEQELLEFSPCPVPANPEALVGAKSAGIDLGLYLKWVEESLDEGEDVVVPRSALEVVHRTLVPRQHVSPGVPDATSAALAKSLEQLTQAVLAQSKQLEAQGAQLRALEQRVAQPAPPPAPAPEVPRAAPRVSDEDLAERVARKVEKRLAALTGRVD